MSICAYGCDSDVWGPDGFEQGDGHNPACPLHGGLQNEGEGVGGSIPSGTSGVKDRVAATFPEGQSRISFSRGEPGPLAELVAEWLDSYGDSRPEGWEPEQADGCWPHACVCGFVERVHRSRLAIGRPCCGEPTHLLLPAKPEVEP